MYSIAGLKEWEIITYSGILAIVALSLATLVGLIISHLVMLVPALEGRPAQARASTAAAEPSMAPPVTSRPNLATG